MGKNSFTKPVMLFFLAVFLLISATHFSSAAGCCVGPGVDGGCSPTIAPADCTDSNYYNDTADCDQIDACTTYVCCCGTNGVAADIYIDPVRLAYCSATPKMPTGQTCDEVCGGTITPVSTFNVTGSVIDLSSNPLDAVAIIDQNGHTLTSTDSSGLFELINVSSGILNITAVKAGCENQSQLLLVNNNAYTQFTLSCSVFPTYRCKDWSACTAGAKTRECCQENALGTLCSQTTYPNNYYGGGTPEPSMACITPNTNFCNDSSLGPGEECYYNPVTGESAGTCKRPEWCSPTTCQCVLDTFCGDGNCSGSETCGTCRSDCGICPTTCATTLPQITLTPIVNEDDFRIDWTFQTTLDCTPVNFTIERFSQGTLQYLTTLPGSSRSYVDENIAPPNYRKNYTYFVRAQFTPLSSSVGNATMEFGNSECIHQAARSACTTDNKGIRSCDINNFLTLQNCSNGTSNSFCTLNEEGSFVCSQQPTCDVCNGPYGSFGAFMFSLLLPSYSSDTYVDCPTLQNSNLCFLDRTTTAVDKYFACNAITSCNSYNSETSCTTDPCRKNDSIGNCEWKSYDNESNLGICRPKDEGLQSCADCNTFPYGCIDDLCTLYGDACYYSENRGGFARLDHCIGTEDPGNPNSTATMACIFYNDQKDCIGNPGRNSSTDANTNILTPSTDLFNLGTCKWQTTCIKDADGDALDDCTAIVPSQKKKCYQDNIAPETNLQMLGTILDRNLASLRFYPTDNSYAGSDIQTFFSFANYPNMTFIYLKDFLKTDEFYKLHNPITLRYFSRDKSHNLEVVKVYPGLTILDSINYTFSLTKYAYRNPLLTKDIWFHNVNITVVPSRSVLNCTTRLTLLPETPNGSISIPFTGPMNSFTIPYEGLGTGNYNLSVVCSDQISTSSDDYSFNLADGNIGNVTPRGKLYGPADASVNVELTTLSNATCKISSRTPYYSLMLDTETMLNIDHQIHTFTAADMNDGLHVYYTGCSITEDTGTYIAQGFGQAAYYFVDKQAPKTKLVDANTHAIYAPNTSERLSLRFLCNDARNTSNELYSIFPGKPNVFGCSRVMYSIDDAPYQRIDYAAVDEFNATSQHTLDVDYLTLNGTHTLKYYSIDAGNNIEPVKQTVLYLGLIRNLDIQIQFANEKR